MEINRRTLCMSASMGVLAGCAQGPAAAAASRIPANERIAEILADRIDGQKRSVGIAVGVVEPQGRRIVTHGTSGTANPLPIRADTVFEIASITKVLTALLLADAVKRGEVKLDDPLSRYLPGGTALLAPDGSPITLTDLATHSSGLPMWPPGASPTTDFGKLATYSSQDLQAFLAAYRPSRSTRAWAYSNVGVGLLGQILAQRAGTDFDGLVSHRIAGPLGMASTAVNPTPAMKERMTAGHLPGLRPAPYWSMPTLAGAADVKSTPEDMVKLLAAFLGYSNTPLKPAMASMLDVRRPGPELEVKQALGWLVIGEPPEQYISFSGATAGFAATITWHPASRTGVVVMSNCAEPVGDIANHLVRTNYPLSPRRKPPVSLDPALLDRYVGRYPVGADAFVVARRGQELTVDPPNLEQAFALTPQSETEFFLAQLGMQLVFDLTADGRVTGLAARQGSGQPTTAQKTAE
jgi:serine-type D-Ala-D-Ala carboxypeptidase/endopeptidase